MTFVHTTTSGHSRRPLELFAHWGAWPLAFATTCLAAWAMTLDPSRATALQFASMAAALLIAALAERVVPISMAVLMALADRSHHGGSDGTHNFGSVLMLWDQLFGTYGRSGSPRAVGVDSGAPRSTGSFSELLEAMRSAVRSPAADRHFS